MLYWLWEEKFLIIIVFECSGLNIYFATLPFFLLNVNILPSPTFHGCFLYKSDMAHFRKVNRNPNIRKFMWSGKISQVSFFFIKYLPQLFPAMKSPQLHNFWSRRVRLIHLGLTPVATPLWSLPVVGRSVFGSPCRGGSQCISTSLMRSFKHHKPMHNCTLWI